LLRGPRQALHRRIAEALEQRFPDFVETRPEILAHHYGEAAIADKAVIYWHLAGKLSVAKSAVREAIAQLRRGLDLLGCLPESRERNQLQLDILVTLASALIGAKGYADPEVVKVLENAQRLVIETAGVGTPLLRFRQSRGRALAGSRIPFSGPIGNRVGAFVDRPSPAR